MKLGGYRFGKIEVDGVPYHEDLWICAGRIGRWWRKEGHRVHLDDLVQVLELSPETLIIGTGFASRVQVTQEVRDLLSSKGIELFVLPTKETVDLYNQLVQKKRVAVLLHLTC
ncbi:MAG: Mth938-like domain-containing protein [Candidatus Bipolaricaulaceae bacterium]